MGRASSGLTPKERMKLYYQANAEKLKADQRKRYEANKEEHLEYVRWYNQEHKEELKIKRKERDKRRKMKNEKSL